MLPGAFRVATLLTALCRRHPAASYPQMRPLPLIGVASLNGQPSFLFACQGAGYSLGLSTVTGEVVLPFSLA